MNKICLVLIFFCFPLLADYDAGLTCSSKESIDDESYSDIKILLDRDGDKVRFFQIEIHKSEFQEPWDEIYPLSKEIKFYNWNSIGTTPDNEPSDINFMRYALNRETLLLNMNIVFNTREGKVLEEDKVPCILNTHEDVLSQIQNIYNLRLEAVMKKQKEQEKRDKEQLKKNKI